MTPQEFYDRWQEWIESTEYTERNKLISIFPHEVTIQELHQNLSDNRFNRKEQTIENGKHFIPCPLTKTIQHITDIAVTNCKTKDEWRNEEADDIRWKASGIMPYKRIDQLIERYLEKMLVINRTLKWYEQQISDCHSKITVLEQDLEHAEGNKALYKINNKLTHWRDRLANFENHRDVYEFKSKRFVNLCMKWIGIYEVVKQKDIAGEIYAERHKDGNKYGFNPLAQSRETAEIQFED